MKLVYEKSGKPVQIGDRVTTGRGEKYYLQNIELPRHGGSTGRVYVSKTKNPRGGAFSTMSYFPSVIGAKWIGREDQGEFNNNPLGGTIARTGKLIPTRIGNVSDSVSVTISRKNVHGEYVVRLWKNGKHYKPADYFTNDANDAEATGRLMYDKEVATVNEMAYEPHKKLSQSEMLKNPSDILSGKSIQTEYFGPGNTRGARIRASVIDGNKIQKSMSISYPHELDMYAAHIFAAEQLRDKMGWSGDLIGVSTQKGYVFGFKKFTTASFGFQRNPTLRATRKTKPKLHSRTHFDTGNEVKTNGNVRSSVYVQQQRGSMWFTLAVAKNSVQGRKLAEQWAQRYHRKHPGSKLRLYV